MPVTPGVEIASGKPAPALLVVQFRALGSTDVAIKSPSYDHLAAHQQCRGMQIARSVEAARCNPTLTRRIIQFRAHQSAAVKPPGNEHRAVGQQCRCMLGPCGVEVAGGNPSSAYWIIKFRAD